MTDSSLALAAPRAAPPTASRPILWLIGFFAFLNVYSIQAVLPSLMRDFQASPVAAGATVGATVLAVALLSPFVGMLSDSLGRKGLLTSAMLFLTLPTALIPWAGSLDLIVVLRFFQGLAIPGITVVLMAYIGEEFEGQGVARMMAAYVSGTVLGGFSGRFITGHLDTLVGWRGAFLFLAGLNLAGTLAVHWRLPASRHFRPHGDIRGALANVAGHLGNRPLMAAAAVGFFVLFSLVGTFTYVTVLLAGTPFRLSSSALANVFAVYLIGVAATPLAGRLVHRLGYRGTLLCAVAASAAGIGLTLIPDLASVIAGLTLASSGVFFAQSASISYVAANVRAGRSLASGIYNMAYYAGGAVGAWVCGWAYVHAGWAGTAAAVLAAQALAMSLAWFGWRKPGR